MDVQQWPTDKVRPYAGNPRKRDKRAVEQVARSLKEFGWRQPIVVDDDGVIVVGHTRFAAAQSLGMQSVPVHVATGLSQDQLRAYRIADNKTNEFTQWDAPLLAMELKTLDDLEMLELSGFQSSELASLNSSHANKGEGLSKINVTLADPLARVVVGDVWKLGHHVLVVESVIAGWSKWVRFLEDGMLLCPYPTPHVTLTRRAERTACLLIQPDAYIAGHCIDRFEEVYGGAVKGN